MPKITVDLSKSHLDIMLGKMLYWGELDNELEEEWIKEHLEVFLFKGVLAFPKNKHARPHIVIDNVSKRSKTERSDTFPYICGSTDNPLNRGSEVEQKQINRCYACRESKRFLFDGLCSVCHSQLAK